MYTYTWSMKKAKSRSLFTHVRRVFSSFGQIFVFSSIFAISLSMGLPPKFPDFFRQNWPLCLLKIGIFKCKQRFLPNSADPVILAAVCHLARPSPRAPSYKLSGDRQGPNDETKSRREGTTRWAQPAAGRIAQAKGPKGPPCSTEGAQS